MEDLQSLQKKLMEIQKSGGGFKLSERTVVDIIQKIVNRGKIKLVFTTNGKEYVADEKISKEITDEIKRNQGRISKIELVKTLEVPSNLIDSKINLLISKDKSLNLIEGKIITNYYMENMCIEINEMLKETGCVFLTDLSTKFDLSIDFFKRFIRDRVGSSIKAKLYETRLLTADYVQKEKQRIRPILIGSTTPIEISYLITNYQIDELIAEDLIKNLISNGIVKGRVIGNFFEPAIYTESQASFVKGVLMQNNYIEYIELKKIGILKNPKEYIKDLKSKEPNNTYLDGIFLKEYFISSQLKNNFEYIFQDNFIKGNSTNLCSIFLFELNEEDINILLENMKYNPNLIIISNMNIIPAACLESFLESIKPKLKEEASKQYNSFITKFKENEKKKAEEQKEAENSKKKGKGKQKKKYQDEEEDVETAENYISLNANFKKDLEALFFKLTNLDELNNKPETVKEIFDKNLHLKILQQYENYIKEYINSKSQTSNDPRNMMNQIEKDYFEFKFIQKSLENLTKGTNANLGALIHNICKKDLNNFFINLLTYQFIHMKKKIEINDLSDPNKRKNEINKFQDEDIKLIFSTLNDNLQNKKFFDFMDHLTNNFKNLAISLTNLDKKKEKGLIEKYNAELTKTIEEKLVRVDSLGQKDCISLTVDICHLTLLTKGNYLKMPHEIWVVEIFSNLLPELKEKLLEIYEILKSKEESFINQQSKVADLIKDLFKSS